jgi:hypothetical protein
MILAMARPLRIQYPGAFGSRPESAGRGAKESTMKRESAKSETLYKTL